MFISHHLRLNNGYSLWCMLTNWLYLRQTILFLVSSPLGSFGRMRTQKWHLGADPNSRRSWTISKGTIVRFDCSENAQWTETSLFMFFCFCVSGQRIIQITDYIRCLRAECADHSWNSGTTTRDLRQLSNYSDVSTITNMAPSLKLAKVMLPPPPQALHTWSSEKQKFNVL